MCIITFCPACECILYLESILKRKSESFQPQKIVDLQMPPTVEYFGCLITHLGKWVEVLFWNLHYLKLIFSYNNAKRIKHQALLSASVLKTTSFDSVQLPWAQGKYTTGLRVTFQWLVNKFIGSSVFLFRCCPPSCSAFKRKKWSGRKGVFSRNNKC